MANCNTLSNKELYDKITKAYSSSRGYEINDLATAIRSVINTKFPEIVLKKYKAVNEFIQDKTFSELFTKRSATLNSFVFNDEVDYSTAATLQVALVDHGASENFATALSNHFISYREAYLNTVAADTRSPIKGKEEIKAYYEAPLQILYGDPESNGTFTLPDSVLFTTMILSYRQASTIPINLNKKEIADLVYGNPDATVDSSVYAYFEGGGMNINTAIMRLGTEIYHSMNIRAVIEKRDDIIFDPATVDSAEGLATRLKYALGLIAISGTGSKISLDGTPLFKSKFIEVPIEQSDGKGNIIEITRPITLVQVPEQTNSKEELTNFGKLAESMSEFSEELDLLLGDSESSYEPSNSPITNIKKTVRNSIFKINKEVQDTIKYLQKQAWTKNDGFRVFLGTDKQVIRELHGWKDPKGEHIDNMAAQEAKNAAIDREIDNLYKYDKLGRLEEFYVPYKAMTTNRYIQLGPISPQNTKLHRNVITPVGSRVQINNSTLELYSLFRLAVAQAFDQDIDKTDLEGGIELFNSIVKDANTPGTDLYKAMQAHRNNDAKTLSDLLLSINDQYGAGPGLLKGIPALSNYMKAYNSETGNFKEFSTDITIESDGVTNGFAISILQFAGGLFKDGELTASGLRKLNQVGFTMSDQDGNMGSRFKSGFPDAYTEFGFAMRDVLQDNNLFIKYIIKVNRKGEEYVDLGLSDLININNLEEDSNKVLRAINRIGYDLTQNSIIRKMAKTPFMVYNYGAMFNSISREIAEDISTLYRDKVVNFQRAYLEKGANKQKILKEVNQLFAALSFLGEKQYSEGKIKEKLESGSLHKIPLDGASKVGLHIAAIYKPIVTHAANEVLGDLTEYREAFIEAAELQFFIFEDALEIAVHKLIPGTQSFLEKFRQLEESQKIELIHNQLLEVYPHFKGPFAGRNKIGNEYIKDAIDLIKVNYSHSSSNVVKVATKDGVKSTQVRTLGFEAPGASALIRPIQNIDSALLTLAIRAANGGVSPIHDALDTPLHLTIPTIGAYNKSYLNINQRFSMFDQIWNRLDTSWNALGMSAQERINAKYSENGFKNQYLPKDEKIEFNSAMGSISELVTKNNEAREALFVLLNKDGVLIEQMYSAIGYADFGKDSKVGEGSKLLGSSPEEVVKLVNDIFNNQKLSVNATKIFEMLAGYNSAYVSEQSHKEEIANLNRVLIGIILPVVGKIEEVTIDAGLIQGGTVGAYSPKNRKILLNINENVADTHTEQSDAEIFIHESLHPLIHHLLKEGDPVVGSLQDLHAYAREHVTVEDFLNKDEQGNIIFRTDPELERLSAQRQYDYFIGEYHINHKGERVESTLEEFVVGALTNKHLVKRLLSMQQPSKDKFWEGHNIIQKIINAIGYLIERFNANFRPEKLTQSTQSEIFNLVQQLVGAQEKQRKHVAYKLATEAKNKLYSKFKEGVNLGLGYLDKDGKGKTFIPNAAYVFRNLPEALQVAETQQAFSKAYSALSVKDKSNTVLSLIKEATVGTTNVHVEKMLLLSKHLVEAQRKHVENTTIGAIRKSFLTPFEDITDLQHENLTKTVLRLDLSSLMYQGNMSAEEIVELLRDPAKLQTAINSYAKSLNIANNTLYAQHTKALAELISMRRTKTTNMSLNASTIHTIHALRQPNPIGNPAEVKMLDTYVTLLGIQMTPKNVLDSALEVIDKEQSASKETGDENGFTFILRHHKNFKEESLEKLFDGNPIQMRKGYLANITDPHVDIVAATAEEAKELLKSGYREIGNLAEYDGVDNTGLKLYVSYYHIEPTKVAGVLSFTQKRKMGSSLFEILSRRPENQEVNEYGEIVPNAAKIRTLIRDFTKQQIIRAKQEEKFGVGNKYQMIPLRDDATNITDYRIEMSYQSMEAIYKADNLDMKIDKTLGRMQMHMSDKIQSEKVNTDAVKYLAQDYADNRKREPSAYVDLFDPYYFKHFYSILPKDLKKKIKAGALKKKKGGREILSFPIRRDNLLTFFGHKRLSMANLAVFSKMPYIRFGIKQLEEVWQRIVALAIKNVIIKEIGGVPGPNMVSNAFVSMTAGMTPLDIKRYWSTGWKEVEKWKEDAKELGELHLILAGANSNNKDMKLKTRRLFALQARLKESPITRLMQLGLFTSISEDVELREFDYLTRIGNSVDKRLNTKVSQGISTVARGLYWTEKSKVFQNLHHFTQTMDFVARYGLYQHLINKKKLSENDALAQVFDAFVLYDRPLDPKLDYLNKMGGFLFVKFWLFIQRYLYKQAKREPANVALLLGMQGITGIDVPDVYDSSILLGNALPPIGGFDKIMESIFYVPLLDQTEDITGLPVDVDVNPF